jgi:hypothetical protein
LPPGTSRLRLFRTSIKRGNAEKWGILLTTSPEPKTLLTREEGFFRRAFPGSSPRPFSLAAEFSRVRIPVLVPLPLPGSGRLALAAALAATSLHLRIILRFLPLILLSFGGCTVLGALLRERIRFGHGYASPALAYVAKRVLGISAAYLAIWSLSPLPVPYWTLPSVALLGLLGNVAHLANLPVRL